MSNKRHHEIVEIQKSNRRIRKAALIYSNSEDGRHTQKWRRKKNKRFHLFFMHREYKEAWRKARQERRKKYEENHI